MNDGIYLPFDESRFKAYRDGIYWLHHELEKAVQSKLYCLQLRYMTTQTLEQKAITWCSTPIPNGCFRKGIPLHWEVADIHFPMTKYLEEKGRPTLLFKLAEDGVHPGEMGHWLMAKAILLYLGQRVEDAADIKSAIAVNAHASEIYAIVTERQLLMKDAWFSAAGHTRPGMNLGMPLYEARIKYDSLQQHILALLK